MPVPPPLPGVRPRRRPGLLALGVALTATGALATVWLVGRAGERVAVLAVAHDVAYGDQLSASDLVVTDVTVDSTVPTIGAAHLEEILGTKAAVPMSRGALLGWGSVTTAAAPGPGQVLVPIALPSKRMPAQSLVPGDEVLVVDTPVADADPPSTAPRTVAAVVMRLSDPDLDGVSVVDLAVPAADGPLLAARAATGRIALVVQPRGQ